MEEMRRESHTDGMCKKPYSRSKSSSQLFVPRASVIRHTKDVGDVKLHNTTGMSKLFSFESANYKRDISRGIHSKPEHHSSNARCFHPKPEHYNKHDVEKKEEKDSGIDESFDEEEKSCDDSATSSGNDESIESIHEQSMDTGISSMDTGISSGDENIDVCTPDDEPMRNFIPTLEGRYPEERYPDVRYPEGRYSEERYTEESVSPRLHNFNFSGEPEDTIGPMIRPLLLKDPHLAYMLKLYQQASGGSAKDTLPRMDANVGSAKTKVETYLKEHNNHSKTNTHPPEVPVDFSVAHQNKYYPDMPERKPVSVYEPVRVNTNSLYALSSENYNMYGYENPASSSGNPNIYNEGKSSYINELRTPPPPPPHLFANNSRLPITPYDNNLQCEYCHKKFNNEEAAKRHLLTHKGKRTHKCTHCSRSFYEQASFMRHLKSHSGEKAHKCDQCSMAFSKRSALEVHIRTHTGERPFVCKYCGKGFSISGNLHRHVLIHTGHRPYKCGKCPRAFNNPSHLARHISSFHT